MHFLDRAPSRISPYTGLVVRDDVEEIVNRHRYPKPSIWSQLQPKDVWLYDLIYDPYLGPPSKRDFSRDKDRNSGKICPLLMLWVE